MKKTLEEILAEPTKGSRIDIPETLLDKIKEFQEVSKKTGNGRISREQVVIRILYWSFSSVDHEIKRMKKEFIES